MKLVIVESPHKCTTIKKYLGAGYEVKASVGHLDDLATSGTGGFGIDVNNDFKATYVLSKGKIQTADDLKQTAKKATEVILATDPDREGEAIAWHLTQILGLDPATTKRLEFHEITHESIEHAIANPRVIDMNLVNSQETRRIIDRVIGFKLSGIMNRKIKSKSAGRVQSATLKLIFDHEEEIKNFKPEEYWTLSLNLSNDKTKIVANYLPDEENKKISNEKENKEIISKLGKEAEVIDISKSFRSTESKPAFTTSTMIQEACSSLRFSSNEVTKVAQLLYEGVQIGAEHVGLVTYIRTDSVAISNEFSAHAKKYIEQKYGHEYVGHRKYAKVKGSQDAHEAIRPTSLYRTPESIKDLVPHNLYKLYKLIYERTIGSLMTAKKDEVITVKFKCGNVKFKSDGYRNIFDGYSKIYRDSDTEKVSQLPNVLMGDIYHVDAINNKQEFTKAPSHYNEAKIVHIMEEKGIGRPSTYASTIKTLLSPIRGYLHSDHGSIEITDHGSKTAFVLNKYFPELINVAYTAKMEQDLDKIQDGKETKTKILTNFYFPFMKLCDEVNGRMYKDDDENVGRNCPKCGAPLVYKKSRYGEFIGCSNFPKCDYRENDKKIEYAPGNCPKCGKPLVYRYSKTHKKFVACSGYPECDYIEKKEFKNKREPVKKCPECGGDLYVRYYNKKKILGCSNYPKCHHQEEYHEDKK